MHTPHPPHPIPHPLPIDHRLHGHCCPPPPPPPPAPLPPLYPGPLPMPPHPVPPPPCYPPMTTKVYNAIDVVAGENIEVTQGTIRGMTAFQVSAPEMVAPTETDDGKAGVVPAPTTEDIGKYLCSDGTWGTPGITEIFTDDSITGIGTEASPLSVVSMTGATETTNGTKGIVPAPTSADAGKYLKGDGTWAEVPIPDVMVGATTTQDGTAGIVPAPTSADSGKYLKGDGTWAALMLPTFTELTNYDEL